MNPSLVAVLCATGPLVGQAVSIAVSGATALTVRASAAAANDVQTLPIGPLAASGSLVAQVVSLPTSEGASMSLNWQTTPPGQLERLTFGCSFLGWVTAGATPASAGVDPFALVLQLQAPSPRRVLVAGNVVVATSPGQPAPQFEVDLFDDGTVEWSTVVALGPIALVVGPAPTAIRIRGTVALASGSAAAAQGAATLEITPDNRIDLASLPRGCLGEGFLRCEQAFAHDGLRLRAPAAALCVGVLGLGVQPLVLSTYFGDPCVLLPSPDVLLVIPANGLDLPIPAAARPIVVYSQGVWVDVPELPTTACFRAFAF